MEKLTATQQQQIKKMADDRLRIKLVALGYEEETVMTWEREELIARYAEAVLAGHKPKVEPTGGDPALERERLAFEREKLEVERQKAEMEHQRFLAEREDKRRQEETEERRHTEDVARKDNKAAKAKMYGDAVRGSIIRMGADPLDAIPFFRRVEQLFQNYEIPEDFQANVISPYLSDKARVVVNKLSPEITAVYKEVKAAILKEFKLSPNSYLERFNTCAKTGEETYVAFASKLRGLLQYYLDSRNVSEFDKLCELLVCDRIKSTLSENCMRYILSIESGNAEGWLPVKELTESIDRFVASHGDAVRPRAFALGQTPVRSYKPVSGVVKPKSPPTTPKQVVGDSSVAPRSNTPKTSLTTPSRQVICYECGQTGHVRTRCPNWRTNTPRPAVASTKGVSVEGSVPDKTGSSQTKAHVNKIGLESDVTPLVDDDVVILNETQSNKSSDFGGDFCDELSVNDVEDMMSICCPVAQLAYIDVALKTDNQSQDCVVKGLVDTGAQVPVVKGSLLPYPKPEVMGKIKLRPFCGESVPADWIKIMMALPGGDFIMVDCAVMDNLNEDLILTADVVSRLGKGRQKILVKETTSSSSDDSEFASTLKTSSDTNIDDVICDYDVSTNNVDDDVSDVNTDINTSDDIMSNINNDDVVNHNDVDVSLTPLEADGNDSSDLALSNVVAQEQQEDETLKGCFALARAGKGGYEIHDGLLYHCRTELGESFLQLVVPLSRR